tara:strand:- start:41 stop:322 length:282 start_codon:yes stop_codon:yes gene_type:complete
MSTYRLFCGRSIPSGGYVTESEVRTYEKILNQDLNLDFTRINAVGSYQLQREETLIYTVVADQSTVIEAANRFKELFNQESVGVQKVADLEFV